MSTFTLLLLVGLASTACQILFALSVHRLRLLIFSIAASALFLVQYLILGQWIGFWSGVAGTTYTIMLALAYKYPVLQKIVFTYIFAGIYVAVFVMLNDWVHFEAYQAIPLIGGGSLLFALHSRNLILTKAMFIGAGALWLGYEFANTMFTQMVGEGFEFVGNVIALCALVAAKRKGIHRRDMINIDQQALEAFTGSITLPGHHASTHAQPLPRQHA